MVHTLTVLTLQLAQAIGLYLVAAGISGLRSPERWREIVADIERSAGIADLFGVASFAIGVAILIPHHVVYDPLSIVVTLIAALSVIEGLLLLAFPDVLLALARPFVAATRLWAIVALIAGVLLVLAGLTGRADALP
ncbi:DUF2065 family protein [uncultured Sphingomonas sp.]|uniref:DUF2065 family protein n=1 Tax=uncultured Sphingomonas sp. TaxID=158754 RepID=UPI002614A7FF|nr:DUF2065 family protein [uncultured Sphingomonas sp.]